MIIDESNDDLNGYECCNKIDGRQRGMTTRMVTNAVTKLMGAHDVQRTVSWRSKLMCYFGEGHLYHHLFVSWIKYFWWGKATLCSRSTRTCLEIDRSCLNYCFRNSNLNDSTTIKLCLLSSLERDVLFWRRTPTLLTYLSLGSNIFGEGRRRFVLVPLELA